MDADLRRHDGTGTSVYVSLSAARYYPAFGA
jgi:hypothetical protein